MVTIVMAATRVSDGAQVMLKKLRNSESSTNEIEMARLFSSPPHSSHPSNRCIPLLDVLSLSEEGITFIVTPFLSHWECPPFDTVGEALAFFQQMFEVLFLPLRMPNITDAKISIRALSTCIVCI
jgi:hypothetical protein